jgi:hypothetical protein
MENEDDGSSPQRLTQKTDNLLFSGAQAVWPAGRRLPFHNLSFCESDDSV